MCACLRCINKNMLKKGNCYKFPMRVGESVVYDRGQRSEWANYSEQGKMESNKHWLHQICNLFWKQKTLKLEAKIKGHCFGHFCFWFWILTGFFCTMIHWFSLNPVPGLWHYTEHYQNPHGSYMRTHAIMVLSIDKGLCCSQGHSNIWLFEKKREREKNEGSIQQAN